MPLKEIRCKHCQAWNKWDENLYCRCSNCSHILQEELILEEEKNVEKQRILNEELKKEIEIESNLHPVIRLFKRFANIVFMGIVLFFALIVLLLVG